MKCSVGVQENKSGGRTRRMQETQESEEYNDKETVEKKRGMTTQFKRRKRMDKGTVMSIGKAQQKGVKEGKQRNTKEIKDEQRKDKKERRKDKGTVGKKRKNEG